VRLAGARCAYRLARRHLPASLALDSLACQAGLRVTGSLRPFGSAIDNFGNRDLLVSLNSQVQVAVTRVQAHLAQ
jgi:hypothetical protein